MRCACSTLAGNPTPARPRRTLRLRPTPYPQGVSNQTFTSTNVRRGGFTERCECAFAAPPRRERQGAAPFRRPSVKNVQLFRLAAVPLDNEHPQETAQARLLRHGPASLTDAELVSLVLPSPRRALDGE